jgi:hypothetical protein
MKKGGEAGMKKQDSSFSEEKEAKRLLFMCSPAAACAYPMNKSFLVLFFKKEQNLL